MRRRINPNQKGKRRFPSTPKVANIPGYQPNILYVTGRGWSVNQAKLVIRDALGQGAQGEVFDAVLIFNDSSGEQHEYPCVAKHLFTHDDPKTPTEFTVQKELSDEQSSGESGLLHLMGIHTVTDDQDKTHKYAIMPKCDAMLSDYVSRITELQKTQDSKALYFHVVMNFFRSMCHGVKNLAMHRMVHRDLKPENIGLHNEAWCILDFGLTQRYEDFITNKVILNGRKRAPIIEGTSHYIPPERLYTKANKATIESKYPVARDVWSIGQILRKFSGKKCSFQDDAEGNELNCYQHLYVKGNAYSVEREKTVGLPSFNDESHQAELEALILKKQDFEDCLDCITNLMCDILPERRPSLQTLLKACEHMESLLAPIVVSSQSLKQFYRHKKPVYSSPSQTTHSSPRSAVFSPKSLLFSSRSHFFSFSNTYPGRQRNNKTDEMERHNLTIR